MRRDRRQSCPDRPRPVVDAPHSHGASEEIVFVLGGSGFSSQDEQVYELRPGDCIVHLADREEHTLRGGPEGLDVLIYGTRHPTEIGWLPRSGAVRFGWPWVAGRTDDPWAVEAQAEPLAFAEPAPRPGNIVNVEDVEPEESQESDCEVVIRRLARKAGSVRTGMRHELVPEGKLNCPPHCHGSEEEFFVVLDGEGTCLLGDEEHPVRRGSIGRPPGTGVAHAFRGPLTLLTYGTNEPNEICYYPPRTRSASSASASSAASRSSTTGTASLRPRNQTIHVLVPGTGTCSD